VTVAPMPPTAPSLTELLEHPERANDLPVHIALDLLPRIAGLQAMLFLRALGNGHRATSRDRLLRVAEAARKLGHGPDWLYKHASSLPFTVREGRALR